MKNLAFFGIFPILFGSMYYFLRGQLVPTGVSDSILFTVGLYAGVGLLILDSSFLSQKYAEHGVAGGILITRSVLFMLSLVPLAFYMLTSTGSSLGIGLVFGTSTGLVIEMLSFYKQPMLFNQRFLSQLKEKLSEERIKSLLVVVLGLWLLYFSAVFLMGSTLTQ